MGVAEQSEAFERVQLLTAEAGQRASEAATGIARGDGPRYLVVALEVAGKELLRIHRRLFEAMLGPPNALDRQLTLDPGELRPVRDEAAPGASALAPTLDEVNEQHDEVNEQHMAEVEGVLFLMSGARRRAERATRDLAKDGAQAHLVEAMEQAEQELEATIDAFFKSTYFHVPKDQLALS